MPLALDGLDLHRTDATTLVLGPGNRASPNRAANASDISCDHGEATVVLE